jgi:hypothetical protein
MPPLGEIVSGAVPIEGVWVRTGSLTLYGTGVGIDRDGHRQFRVSAEALRSILARMVEARFLDLPDAIGGRRALRLGPGSGASVRIAYDVWAGMGNAAKSVTQFQGGKQSETLEGIRRAIMAEAETEAEPSVGCSGLGEALVALGEGRLAPESLSLVVHEYDRLPTASAQRDWRLYVRDGRLRVCRLQAPLCKEVPVRRPEAEQRVRALGKLLADNHAEGFPGNLWFDGVLDLDIEVLGFRLNVQAAPFARVTKQTHGAKQESFNRVYEGLRRLHALCAGEAER